MDIEKLKTSRKRQDQLEQLSPFELKDSLIALASYQQKKPVKTMLNAGRGNPNWTATVPREAFFTLGRFGIEENKRTMSKPSGLSGIPQKAGIAKRFEDFLSKNNGEAGIELLHGLYKYGIDKHGFDPDSWVFELAEGVIGDQYPSPVRMLKHTEQVVHDYLIQEMCGNDPIRKGKYDLFAVEGGTAAMCYIFDSLIENCLLKKGDRIGLLGDNGCGKSTLLKIQIGRAHV